MQQIEYGVWRRLWQALKAQEAIGRDPADDVTGLVNRGDDKAVRRAATHRHVNVAEIICPGRKAL